MQNIVQDYWRVVRHRIIQASCLAHKRLDTSRARRKQARRVISRNHSRRRYIPALGVLLCAASHGTTLPHWEFAVPTVSEAGKDWFCQTEVLNDRWYMRCGDLGAILRDDPVLQNHVASPAVKLIPLFGAPFADSPLSTLAKSVLCGGDKFCNVVVAAW